MRDSPGMRAFSALLVVLLLAVAPSCSSGSDNQEILDSLAAINGRLDEQKELLDELQRQLEGVQTNLSAEHGDLAGQIDSVESCIIEWVSFIEMELDSLGENRLGTKFYPTCHIPGL